MFHVRDISYRLIWMKFTNMLSVYAQSGTHRRLNRMNYCGFNIERFCSDVCEDHWRPQTLAEIYRNMVICCGFMVVAARGKYPGFILLLTSRDVSVRGTSFRTLDWTFHQRTQLWQVCILNKDILQWSFRLCNWLALRCCVPWINQLSPVCWSTFLEISSKQQLACKFDIVVVIILLTQKGHSWPMSHTTHVKSH